MAKRKSSRIYTIYDRMEERGEFDSEDSTPKQFPRILYHPRGETEVMDPGEIVNQPWGPERINRKEVCKTRLVNNEAELKAALEEGWRMKLTDPLPDGVEPKLDPVGQKIKDHNAKLAAQRAAV